MRNPLFAIYPRFYAAANSCRFPIRRGVLVALLECHTAIVEVAVFPFIFSAPESRLAWEARNLLRAGPRLEPLDPWSALRPLQFVLENHQVRVLEVADLAAPDLRHALQVDLLVVLDAAARGALQMLPFEVSSECAVLADEVPWQVLSGAPLPDLFDDWMVGVEGHSPFYTCALMGMAIEPCGAVFKPVSYLICAHRAQFPELSWEGPPGASE